MFCRLNICTPRTQPHQWQQNLQQFDLNPTTPPPLFQVALEQACGQLSVAIAWCGLVSGQQVRLTPNLGLDQLPQGQHLRTQGLPYTDSYAQYIIDAQQPLCINSTTKQAVFATSPLCQVYGIRAYCGVPLLTSDPEVCLGVLAVAALEPRSWQAADVAWLTLLARWVVAVQERDRAVRQAHNTPAIEPKPTPTQPSATAALPKALLVKLLQELAAELRTPLTPMMGMTRMLEKQVYGILTEKQAEYVGIIRQSGEQLLARTEEMMGLGALIEQEHDRLNPSSTDVEMLMRQVLQQLAGVTDAQQHQIQLSVEPGHRLWLLDKEKIIPAIYHLLYSLLNNLNPGSQVQLHLAWPGRLIGAAASHPAELQLDIWATHPQLMAYRANFEFDPQTLRAQLPSLLHPWLEQYPIVLTILDVLQAQSLQTAKVISTPDVCRLLLCCELLRLHQGRLSLRAAAQAGEGYRYGVKLPAWTPELSPDSSSSLADR
ncbi:MAG: histidine kinase dimerization/phospho-acceptor domain-containing protein [Spirulinaceae cyanobacterium]